MGRLPCCEVRRICACLAVESPDLEDLRVEAGRQKKPLPKHISGGYWIRSLFSDLRVVSRNLGTEIGIVAERYAVTIVFILTLKLLFSKWEL